MREKIQNEPAKVEVWKMFGNDLLSNILKAHPPPAAFFNGGFNLYTEFED